MARVGQAWRESDVAEVARATGTAGAVLKFLFLDLVFERLIEAAAAGAAEREPGDGVAPAASLCLEPTPAGPGCVI